MFNEDPSFQRIFSFEIVVHTARTSLLKFVQFLSPRIGSSSTDLTQVFDRHLPGPALAGWLKVIEYGDIFGEPIPVYLEPVYESSQMEPKEGARSLDDFLEDVKRLERLVKSTRAIRAKVVQEETDEVPWAVDKVHV